MSFHNWFPDKWRNSAAPMLTEPGYFVPDNTVGTAFYIEYQNNVYAVTATHVLTKCNNPMLCYYDVQEKLQRISSKAFSDVVNLKWIDHPDGSIDISAIPFTVEDHMDIHVILESDWNILYDLDPDDKILHTGYPKQYGTTYVNGAIGYLPTILDGTVAFYDDDKIVTYTDGQGGASGGPLFMKGDNERPQLIGIAYHSVPTSVPEQNMTSSLPIHLLKPLLDSKQMKDQMSNYQKILRDNM